MPSALAGHKAETPPWKAWRADMARWHEKMGPMGPFRRWFYMWTEPTPWATTIYRFNQALYAIRIPVVGQIAHLLSHLLRVTTRTLSGVDLAPSVQIGPGFYLGHPGGVHIHEDVRIGSNCNLNHEVTIGVGGQGKRRGVPTIGSCVFISAGAKIYGKIEIGDYVMIGPNAVVSRSIPSCSVVGGIPGRVIARTTEQAVRRIIFGEKNADKHIREESAAERVSQIPAPASVEAETASSVTE